MKVKDKNIEKLRESNLKMLYHMNHRYIELEKTIDKSKFNSYQEYRDYINNLFDKINII
jgi:hypothetical protein